MYMYLSCAHQRPERSHDTSFARLGQGCLGQGRLGQGRLGQGRLGQGCLRQGRRHRRQRLGGRQDGWSWWENACTVVHRLLSFRLLLVVSEEFETEVDAVGSRD